jgi:Cupin-like domain
MDKNALALSFKPEVREHIEQAFRQGLEDEIVSRFPELQVRKGLSLDEFESEFRHKQRPVLLQGSVCNWPAVHKWNFDFLSEKCSRARVLINTHSPTAPRSVTIEEFVRLARHSAPGDSPIYLQEWYFQDDCPLLSDDIKEIPERHYDFKHKLYGPVIGNTTSLWIGQKGAITIFHRDASYADVIHAQIYGSKVWYIFGPNEHVDLDNDGSPDFETYLSSHTPIVTHCVTRPGDVLYLPARWYHRLRLLEDSIGLSCAALDERNLVAHMRERFHEILPLAVNQDYLKEQFPSLTRLFINRYRAFAKTMGIDLNSFRDEE